MLLLMAYHLDSWETRRIKQSEHLYLKFLSCLRTLSANEGGQRTQERSVRHPLAKRSLLVLSFASGV